jgi:hypothetical protein
MPDPIATSFRPSLAVLNGVPSLLPGGGGGSPAKLYAAWKGSSGDERIWWSSTVDGANWAPQQTISLPNTPNAQVGTDVGPSLAGFNNQLYAAWKGSNGDEKLWYSRFDGANWETQQQMPSPIASSVGPSLANFNGQLYAAWKGSDSDERIWYSRFDGENWWLPSLAEGQQQMPNPIASSVGPSLAEFGGQFFAAWKGSTGDERLWYSSAADGISWVGQEPLPSPIASSVGPSLAEFNGRLYIAWKGSDSDTRIWWTSASAE